jgi:4-hydroxyphenylpyruvate dioxygenase-like putative hemolysin
VKAFGDKAFHHVAVRVEDIDVAMATLKDKGIVFAGAIVGERGGPLRQIFSAPETVNGQAFSVLELAERHRGYQGFSPPQADSLMKSSAMR